MPTRQEPLRNILYIHWNFVAAPYAVSGNCPVKLFFDNGLTPFPEGALWAARVKA